MPHLDDGFIHELLDGEVPSSQLGPIHEHLATCPECRARLESQRQLRDDVDGLIDAIDVPAVSASPVLVRPATHARTRWIRDLAWAASLVLAVGLGYLARGTPVAPVSNASSEPPARAIADSPSSAKIDQPVDKVIANAQLPATPKHAAERPAPIPVATIPAAPAPTTTATRVIDTTKPAGITPLTARDAGELRADNAMDRVAAPPSSLQGVAGRGGGRGGSGLGLAQGAAAARSAQTEKAAPEPIDTVSFPEAMRRLGGSIRLIDGMVPLRLEVQGAYVRVVYSGDLVLRQQLIDGTIVFDLVGPRTIPADSLARLRAKVRP